MVVCVTKIQPNEEEDDDFLEVEGSPSSITLGQLRLSIEKNLGEKYSRDEYDIIKIDGENEEAIMDDDKTIAEILGSDVKDATLYVAVRTLAGVRVKVTNKVSKEKVPLINGETKRWQDFDLTWNFQTPIEVVKDRWWRRNAKGNF